MAHPFGRQTKKTLLELLSQRVPAWLPENAAYYTGDHWQETAGWSGPIPTGEGSGPYIVEIQRAFVSANAIGEVVNRHAGGVLGREPAWGLTVRRPLKEGKKPTGAEQKLIDEAEAFLTNWWDAQAAHEELQNLAATAGWAGRAPIRIMIPAGEVVTDEDGQAVIPVSPVEEAVMRIWLDRPEPQQATIHTDRRTMQDIGIYSYEERTEAGKQTLVELTYLDAPSELDMQPAGGRARVTVVEIVTEDDEGGRISTDVRMPLGGHLMMAELELTLLVTPQVKQQQRLLNLALTMLQRNVVLGGFLERVFLDAQPPGYFEADPENPGKMRFVPAPFKTGAATTNFVQGRVITDNEGQPLLDPQGRPSVTSPDVRWREPVAITTFTGTAYEAKRNILEECHQVHALIAGDATPSGESRIQARADYVIDLIKAAGRVNILGRWLIETVLSLAAYLAGEPGRFDSLRATFECRIDPGPMTAEEYRLVMELVDKKLLSRESGMSRTGVDDVDAEKARIDAEAPAPAPPPLPSISPAGQGPALDNSQGGA